MLQSLSVHRIVAPNCTTFHRRAVDMANGNRRPPIHSFAASTWLWVTRYTFAVRTPPGACSHARGKLLPRLGTPGAHLTCGALLSGAVTQRFCPTKKLVGPGLEPIREVNIVPNRDPARFSERGSFFPSTGPGQEPIREACSVPKWDPARSLHVGGVKRSRGAVWWVGAEL